MLIKNLMQRLYVLSQMKYLSFFVKISICQNQNHCKKPRTSFKTIFMVAKTSIFSYFFQMDKYIVYRNSFSVVLFLVLKAFLYLCRYFVFETVMIPTYVLTLYFFHKAKLINCDILGTRWHVATGKKVQKMPFCIQSYKTRGMWYNLSHFALITELLIVHRCFLDARHALAQRFS